MMIIRLYSQHENNRQIEAVKHCISINKNYLSLNQDKEVFDFTMKAKHNYSLLHIACMFTFDEFLNLYVESDYLVTKVDYEARDKYHRKAVDLVLFNSNYFKRLK